MRLKSIDIYGFKSFAQRTEVVFNAGITGIVGPNGSGKSNIGDAVKWVLGEQNPRELRGGSMQDVIFNGTEKRRRLAYAEVTLLFDNEDQTLRTTFAEVAVTRRLYRSGESEYSLNKAPCRLKDIRELFYDTGIGKDGYSIIGQGRIDEILSSNSEDRRQVFEEAAGISFFRARKEDSERKLARTLDNLDRVRDILEELGNRVEPLHAQAQATLRYQEIASRLKTLEMNIFLQKQDRLTARIQELNDAAEALRDALLLHEAALQDNSRRRAEIDETVRRLDDDISQARAACRMAEDDWRRTQSDAQAARQRSDLLRADCERMARDVQSRKERLVDLSRLSAQGQGDDSQATAALDAAKQALDALQAQFDDASEAALQAENALDAHKADILAAVNRLSDARNTQTQKQAMLTQMTQYLAQLRDNEAELAAQTGALQKRYDDALAQQQAAQEDLSKAGEEAKRLDASVRALSLQGEQTNARVQQLTLGMQAAQGRLKALDEMVRGMEGYQAAVKRALVYAKGDGNVLGVVAHLLQAPKELEIAIDAVLGGSLQHIVTTDDGTAKGLIEYLKRVDGGRATFLPVSTVREYSLSHEERRLLSMPGCLGVASELVSCDVRCRPVLQNLLGRTVVAQDLDAALPIMRAGRYAFRLVTLDGQVMHPGGSMTGGSQRAKATNLLSREREIKELRAQLAADQATLAHIQEDLVALHTRQQEVKALRGEAFEAMHQQEIALAREQEHAFNASSEIMAHAQQLEKTRKAIAQLNDSMADISRDLAALSAGTQTAAVDREELDARTAQLQAELLSKRQAADALREGVTAGRLRCAALEHDMLSLRRDEKRRAEEIESLSDAIARLRENIALLDADARKALSEAQALSSQAQAQEQAVIKARGDTEGLERDRQRQLDDQRALVQESEALHERYTLDGDQLHRTEILLDRARNEHAALSEHMWNTYEATLATAEGFRLPAGEFTLTSGEREAGALRREMRDIGPINPHAVEEYAQTKERFEALSAQQEDLLKAESDLRGLIKRLLSQMEKQFVAEFDRLCVSFRETFVRLFGGGQAVLKLSDPDAPLSCGIEVIAQPPGKKLQLLSLLSGGERALTAIAILFAMLKVKPTPFCILDEIEAALDEANIGYFADYLVEFAQTTQFVVVTHRKGTMERCDALYGVAMEEQGVSSMVSVNLAHYTE